MNITMTTNPTSSTPLTKPINHHSKKLDYINSLRGIAILLVILTHIPLLGNFNINNWYLREFISNGKFGVQLFFIVSAFTLMLSYHNRISEKNKNLNFAIRRFFRIAPLYYMMAIFILIDHYLSWDIIPLPNNGDNIISGFFSHIFFVNSLSPKQALAYIPGGWTISIELLFYLTVPFLCLKLKGLNSTLKFLSVILICSYILNRILFHFLRDPSFNFTNPITQFPIFVVGFTAYHIVFDKNKKIKPSTIAFMIVGLFFFCYSPLPYHILYSFIFGALIVLLAKKPYKLLSNKIFTSIGKLSFSMYIMHFVIIYILIHTRINETFVSKGHILNFIFLYIAVVIISYLVSLLTYTWIEKPFQNIGRVIIQKINM